MNEIHPIALWRNKCDVNVCVWEYVYVDWYLYCVNGFDRLTMEVENCGFAGKIFGLDGVEANREVGNGRQAIVVVDGVSAGTMKPLGEWVLR